MAMVAISSIRGGHANPERFGGSPDDLWLFCRNCIDEHNLWDILEQNNLVLADEPELNDEELFFCDNPDCQKQL